MVKTNSKNIKIEIESTTGTQVDITSYITTVSGPFNADTQPVTVYFCHNCFSLYPEYKFLKKIRLSLWKKYHKCVKRDFGVRNAIPTNRNQRR